MGGAWEGKQGAVTAELDEGPHERAETMDEAEADGAGLDCMG